MQADGFKTGLKVSDAEFRTLETKLDFSEKRRWRSDKYCYIAKYRGLIFEKRTESNYLEIRGSLHKFFHGDNNSMFYHDEQVEAVWLLAEILNRSPHTMKLQNCEIEVLLFMPNARKVLLPNIFQIHGSDFETISEGEVYDRMLIQNERVVKIYNRSTHSTDLVRYEIRYSKSRQFTSLGVEFMGDFLNKKWMTPAYERLTKTFKSILMFDPTLDKRSISQEDYSAWSNQAFWSSLKGMKKKREKDRYLSAVNNHSERLQDKLLLQIDRNYELLLNHN